MKKRIIIIGAGTAGRMIASEYKTTPSLHSNYEIEGFFDDDTSIEQVLSFDVLGVIEDIPTYAENMVASATPISEAIIAIPSIEPKNLTKIIAILSKANIKARIIPPLFEIIKGDARINNMRDIEPSDLLGREEVGFEENAITSFFEGKSILVTGGAGSIGSEIVRQLLNLNVKSVVALDHNENSLYDIILEHQADSRFHYKVSNIQDSKNITDAIREHAVSIVFHAAAHKHVPLMEHCPTEAVKNNIIATKKLLDVVVSIPTIEHFLFVSTDKAVRPKSIMGASKRICERMVLSYAAKYKDKVNFKLTRFGNVLGSSGSVIPIFTRQIKRGGPITVTDEKMIRYFMSIREAARLVIKSVSLDKGNIFILDMGKPMKIVELARNMIALHGLTEDDIKIEFTGIRKGEKLYEEILMQDETLIESPYKKLFVAKNDTDILSDDDVLDMIGQFSVSITRDNNGENRKAEIVSLIKKYALEYDPD